MFISLLLIAVGVMYSMIGSIVAMVITILFDGENISFDASLVIYINSTNIPPPPVRTSKVGCLLQYATELGRPYWIYIIPTHDMHQWLLLQFLVLLMMDAESVRNM